MGYIKALQGAREKDSMQLACIYRDASLIPRLLLNRAQGSPGMSTRTTEAQRPLYTSVVTYIVYLYS